MMEVDSGAMLIGALACALGLPLVLLSVGVIGVRALRGSRWSSPTHAARSVLDRRLAAGEIDVDEYYERESALRSTDSALTRRR
jgi:uncharacterized membrane protein